MLSLAAGRYAPGGADCGRGALAAPCPMSRVLLDLQQLYVEGQVRVGRYGRWCPLLPVGELCRNDEPTLASHFHCRQAFVPARDHLPYAEIELDRRSLVQRAAK